MEKTVSHINRALAQVKCGRRFASGDVIRKDWKDFTDEDFQEILNAGYVTENYEKLQIDTDIDFQSLYFMNVRMPEEKLMETAEKIFADPNCGGVFRMKGFMQLPDNSWVELNATRSQICIRPIEKGQEILIFIGEEMNESAIQAYLQ